jgi:hypothetical protein
MKYIITEEQLRKLLEYRNMNEDITHSNGKLLINGNKYEVEVDTFGEVDIEDVKKLPNGSFDIKASKGFISKTVNLSKERASEILNKVPKSPIVSKGKTSFTLFKVD